MASNENAITVHQNHPKMMLPQCSEADYTVVTITNLY